jgi:hypothetical protein
MNDNLFLEETLPDGSYSVIWQGKNGIKDISAALQMLSASVTTNKIEMWSKSHAESPKGFIPMAFREKNSTQIKISNTLKMLMGI